MLVAGKKSAASVRNHQVKFTVNSLLDHEVFVIG
jgi:hypothetical protein